MLLQVLAVYRALLQALQNKFKNRLYIGGEGVFYHPLFYSIPHIKGAKNMLTRKGLVILIISFFIFCLFSGHSRADSLKIGIFDLQRIMRESKTAMKHRQAFLLSMEQKRKPLLEREDAVKKMEEKLKKDATRMTLEERRLLEEKIATEIKELRRQKEDIDSELKKIDQELTQKILNEMGKVIQDMAIKENYTIIFERNAAGIAYLKDTHDITKKIIEEMQ